MFDLLLRHYLVHHVRYDNVHLVNLLHVLHAIKLLSVLVNYDQYQEYMLLLRIHLLVLHVQLSELPNLVFWVLLCKREYKRRVVVDNFLVQVI